MIKWIKDVLGIGRSKKQTEDILNEINASRILINAMNADLTSLDSDLKGFKKEYTENIEEQKKEKKEKVKKDKKLEKTLYEVLQLSRQSEQNIATLDSNMNGMYSAMDVKLDNSFAEVVVALKAFTPVLDTLADKVSDINTNIHTLSEDVNYVAGMFDQVTPIINQMKVDIDKLANQKTVIASNYSQLQEYVDTSASVGPYDDVMKRNTEAEERLRMLEELEVKGSEGFYEEASETSVQQNPQVQHPDTQQQTKTRRQRKSDNQQTQTPRRSVMEDKRMKRTDDGGLFCNYNGMSGKDLNNQ